MAEILGIVGSVASLVALAQETAQACNKLAKFVRLYRNASSDIADLCDELSDLSDTISLVQQVTLQTSHDQHSFNEDATTGVERTLAGLQKDLDAIEDMITAIGHQQKIRKNSRSRLKWAFKKEDIISAMTTIGRKKQTLLAKLSLMHMNQLRTGVALTSTYGGKLDQVTSCLENLTMRVDTSNREACKEVQRCLQPSFASLEYLVKDNIHQAISTSPQNESLTTLYVESLADQISKTLIQKNPEHFKSTMSSANHCAVRSEGIEPDEQAVVQSFIKVNAGRIAISRHTASQKLACIFGKLEYRYYTTRVPLSASEEGISMDTNMTELSFTLAPWLRSWIKRGGIVSQLTTRYQGFTLNISLPRVVDDEDVLQKPIWKAVRNGDVATLQESLSQRIVYPTDVTESGKSLLGWAAIFGQLDICKLLLQQGAGTGINMAPFVNSPLICAIGTPNDSSHDILRLFLDHGADPTLADDSGWNVVHYNLWAGRASHIATHNSAIQTLIKSDVPDDVNQRDSSGRSLLMLAGSHRLSVHQALLKRGADARALDDAGNTVLHHYFTRFTFCFSCVERVLEIPSILELLILTGADHRHVNCRGQLPHQRLSPKIEATFPVSIYLALASCVWQEALRRSGIDPAGYVSIESFFKLQRCTDEMSHCCLFHRRSFSLKQDRVQLERLEFEDQIIAVLECSTFIQKAMAPFLRRTLRRLNNFRVTKVMEFLSELKTKKMDLDRAGSTVVRFSWDEPHPQSKMELHESNKQQTIPQDCDGVTSDGTSAKAESSEVCERCQRRIKKRGERWEKAYGEHWEKDHGDHLDDWEFCEFWEGLCDLVVEEIDLDTESEKHTDMGAESEQEIDSDPKGEEAYFSAEEA